MSGDVSHLVYVDDTPICTFDVEMYMQRQIKDKVELIHESEKVLLFTFYPHSLRINLTLTIDRKELKDNTSGTAESIGDYILTIYKRCLLSHFFRSEMWLE